MIDLRAAMQLLTPCRQCGGSARTSCSACNGKRVETIEPTWEGHEAGMAWMAGASDIRQLLVRLVGSVQVAERAVQEALAEGEVLVAVVLAARRSAYAEVAAALDQILSRARLLGPGDPHQHHRSRRVNHNPNDFK